MASCGNGEAIDFDIADGKCGPGLEAIQARRVFAPRNGGGGEPGDEDGYVEQARESDQAADMIGMLVRDQDCVELFGDLPESRQGGRECRAC